MKIIEKLKLDLGSSRTLGNFENFESKKKINKLNGIFIHETLLLYLFISMMLSNDGVYPTKKTIIKNILIIKRID